MKPIDGNVLGTVNPCANGFQRFEQAVGQNNGRRDFGGIAGPLPTHVMARRPEPPKPSPGIRGDGFAARGGSQ